MRVGRSVIFVIVLGAPFWCQTGFALAGLQYNPLQDRWETAPDRYELKYNPLEDDWSYEAPGSDLEYNPLEDRWEWSAEPAVIQPYPCEVEFAPHHEW